MNTLVPVSSAPRSRPAKALLFLLGASGLMALSPLAHATSQTWATDNGGNYSGTWTNGSNGGSGFDAWTLNTNTNANNGFFISGGTKWGMYANTNNGNIPQATAYRRFDLTNTSTTPTQDLFVGSSLKFDLSYGSINAGGFLEVALRNGNNTAGTASDLSGARVAFRFTAGGADWQMTTNGTSFIDTGITYAQGNNATWTFTLNNANTYSVSTSGGGSFTSQALGGTTDAVMNSVALSTWNNLGGNDFIINNLNITGDAAIWKGGGANSSSSTTTNWQLGSAPTSGSYVIFGQAPTVSPTINAAYAVSGVSFDSGQSSGFTVGSSGAGAFTITTSAANSIGIVNNNTSTETLNVPITLGNVQAWNGASGALVFGGTITNGGNRLVLQGNNNITFNSGYSGTGDLVKQGTGIVLFNAATTFGGLTGGNIYVDNGTVAVATGGSLGTTNGTTTGAVNLGGGVIAQAGNNAALNIVNSGVTVANPIDSRYLAGSTNGTKTVGGTFASGVGTYSGNITLHDSLILSAANGGTVAFTGVIATAGSGTNTATPSGGFGAGPDVFINSGASSTGIVEFDNAMTYTGETVVTSGVLQFNGSGSLANSTIRLGSLGLGTLNLIAAGGSTLNVTVNVRAGGGQISASNTGGTSTLGGHFALDGNAVVQEASSTGTLTLTQARSSAVDTLSGSDIKNFTLTVNGAGNITIGSATSSFGTIYNSTGAGNVTYNGTGTLTLNDGGDTYSGVTTISSGTVSVNTLANGGSASSIGNSSNAAANLVLGGGTLSYTGATVSTDRNFTLTANSGVNVTTSAANLSLLGTNTGAFNLTKGGAGTLTLGGTVDNNSLTAAVSAGILVLGKTSSSSVHAVGATLATALTANSGGTAQLGGSGGDQIYDQSNVVVNSGGSFDMNGQSETFNNLNLAGAGVGSAGALVNSSASANSTLTAGVTLASSASIGVTNSGQTLTLGSPVTSSSTLTKVGAGTLALSAASTYTGPTVISAGTLSLTHAGTVGSANGGTLGGTAVTVNSTGTLLLGAANALGTSTTMTLAGGKFNAAGFSDGARNGSGAPTTGMGALTLSSDSTIDFGLGSTASALAFADSHTATWTGTLTITDWNGTVGTPDSASGKDALFFGTTSSGLTSTQLGEIRFQIGSNFYAANIASNGEVFAAAAVPEPTTMAGALALIGFVGCRERRRLRVWSAWCGGRTRRS